MAKDKKSFIVYTDSIHTIKKLVEKDRLNNTNNAGELFLHLLEYTNDLNPTPINDIVELVFEPIKQQLKRDLREWEKEIDKKSKSGYLGGIKSGEARRSTASKNEAPLQSASKNEANEAVTVNVTVNESENKEPPSVFFSEEELLKIKLEQMLIPEMFEIWKSKKINYYSVKEVDYPPLLEIARNIADYKLFKHASIVAENKEEVLKAWKKIVDFIISDEKYLSKKDISYFAIQKNWTSLVNQMQSGIKINSQPVIKIK